MANVAQAIQGTKEDVVCNNRGRCESDDIQTEVRQLRPRSLRFFRKSLVDKDTTYQLTETRRLLWRSLLPWNQIPQYPQSHDEFAVPKQITVKAVPTEKALKGFVESLEGSCAREPSLKTLSFCNHRAPSPSVPWIRKISGHRHVPRP
ncbi:unnamed protein product [Phytophthora fragariaefolia]|uniref:Unnamed protein product n=1 Tax=Phytophthora fragariaefolia TaxID=1490495 RepID=A0A9W6Y1U1_9STRA|nr:unnamed protein product [Phytophthora fragariaefolia]